MIQHAFSKGKPGKLDIKKYQPGVLFYPLVYSQTGDYYQINNFYVDSVIDVIHKVQCYVNLNSL